MKRSPLERRTPLKPGKPLRRKKRLNPFGRFKRRRIEAGEVQGPLRDFVMAAQPPCCDACGKWTDTLRPDHVKKRGMGGAVGDWYKGKGNIWKICLDCDTFRETTSLRALQLLHGVIAREQAQRWGDRYRREVDRADL